MFKKPAKKALCLLLSLCLLAPASGCMEEQAAKPTESESEVVESNASLTPDEQIKLLDNLNGKYAGKTLKIVTTAPALFKSDSEDPLGNAVSERKKLIEKSFDIEIKIVEKTEDEIKKELREAKEKGSFYANMICTSADVMAGLAKEGLLENISSLPYMNLEADYITDSVVQAQTAADKLFFLASDATLSINSASVLFYNVAAVKAAGLDPVGLAENGSFTWEELEAMVSAVNGQGGIKGIDSALEEEALLYSLYSSMGGTFVNGTSAGAELGYSTYIASEVNAVNTGLFKSPTLSYDRSTSLSAEKDALDDFKNGKTAFMVARLDSVAAISEGDVKTEWGILPMPKLSVGQLRYGCAVNSVTSCIAVPVCCEDSGFSGFVLNAFLAASEGGLDAGLRSTYINYYFWNNESTRMLSLIEKNLSYDLGILYSSLPFVSEVGTALLASDDNQTENEEKKKFFKDQFLKLLFG